MLPENEAKKRQGTRTDLNATENNIKENFPQLPKGEVRDKVAENVGVSERTVERYLSDKYKRSEGYTKRQPVVLSSKNELLLAEKMKQRRKVLQRINSARMSRATEIHTNVKMLGNPKKAKSFVIL